MYVCKFSLLIQQALSARDKKASQKLLNEVLKIELGKHFQPADEDANKHLL